MNRWAVVGGIVAAVALFLIYKQYKSSQTAAAPSSAGPWGTPTGGVTEPYGQAYTDFEAVVANQIEQHQGALAAQNQQSGAAVSSSFPPFNFPTWYIPPSPSGQLLHLPGGGLPPGALTRTPSGALLGG